LTRRTRRINETVADSLAASYGIEGVRDAFEVTSGRGHGR